MSFEIGWTVWKHLVEEEILIIIWFCFYVRGPMTNGQKSGLTRTMVVLLQCQQWPYCFSVNNAHTLSVSTIFALFLCQQFLHCFSVNNVHIVSVSRMFCFRVNHACTVSVSTMFALFQCQQCPHSLSINNIHVLSVSTMFILSQCQQCPHSVSKMSTFSQCQKCPRSLSANTVHTVSVSTMSTFSQCQHCSYCFNVNNVHIQYQHCSYCLSVNNVHSLSESTMSTFSVNTVHTVSVSTMSTVSQCQHCSYCLSVNTVHTVSVSTMSTFSQCQHCSYRLSVNNVHILSVSTLFILSQSQSWVEFWEMGWTAQGLKLKRIPSPADVYDWQEFLSQKPHIQPRQSKELANRGLLNVCTLVKLSAIFIIPHHMRLVLQWHVLTRPLLFNLVASTEVLQTSVIITSSMTFRLGSIDFGKNRRSFKQKCLMKWLFELTFPQVIDCLPDLINFLPTLQIVFWYWENTLGMHVWLFLSTCSKCLWHC